MPIGAAANCIERKKDRRNEHLPVFTAYGGHNEPAEHHGNADKQTAKPETMQEPALNPNEAAVFRDPTFEAAFRSKYGYSADSR